MMRAKRPVVSLMIAAGMMLGMGAVPFRAAAAPALAERIAQCTLKPGIYAIVDPATEKTVGILIVYPDCKTEIISVDHVPAEGWEG